MKRYVIPDDGITLIAGTADELKPVYRSMEKAYVRSRTWLYPLYTSSPKFNPDRSYAICINADNTFCVVSASVALNLIELAEVA